MLRLGSLQSCLSESLDTKLRSMDIEVRGSGKLPNFLNDEIFQDIYMTGESRKADRCCPLCRWLTDRLALDAEVHAHFEGAIETLVNGAYDRLAHVLTAHISHACKDYKYLVPMVAIKVA